MRTAVIVLNGLISFLWVWRSFVARRNLPKLPNLLDETYAQPFEPGQQAKITVIVPARNEEKAIEETLRSLLMQQDISIEILAVNDRSTDETGEIMDRLAAEGRAAGKSITAIHVHELPSGWVGKTHAMALAARQATSPWLLFTDGDIIFREDCLRRVFSYAEKEADHLVLYPSLILKTAGERMMLSAFQALSFLGMRPWKLADPNSRDSMGIGAFNFVRSDVYRSIGGFEAHSMDVVEDLRLGHQVKRHGFRQRIAFGRGLIQVHWAPGAFGIIRNVTKNIFAVFRFRPSLLLSACFMVAVLCLTPLFGLFGPWVTIVTSLAAIEAALSLYRYCERHVNGVPAAYALLLPVAACLIVYMMLRSMVVTLARRGIVWRGTFYPLAELREKADPYR